MGSLSFDSHPGPGGARSDGSRCCGTLDASLCAIGRSVHASPRRLGCREHFSRARDSIHDEYSAVRAPYCNTFCSVHSIAYRFAHSITYRIIYRFAKGFPLGIAVTLGEGRERLLESHQPLLAAAPTLLLYSPECVEVAFSQVELPLYGVLRGVRQEFIRNSSPAASVRSLVNLRRGFH